MTTSSTDVDLVLPADVNARLPARSTQRYAILTYLRNHPNSTIADVHRGDPDLTITVARAQMRHLHKTGFLRVSGWSVGKTQRTCAQYALADGTPDVPQFTNNLIPVHIGRSSSYHPVKEKIKTLLDNHALTLAELMILTGASKAFVTSFIRHLRSKVSTYVSVVGWQVTNGAPAVIYYRNGQPDITRSQWRDLLAQTVGNPTPERPGHPISSDEPGAAELAQMYTDITKNRVRRFHHMNDRGPEIIRTNARDVRSKPPAPDPLSAFFFGKPSSDA